MKTMNDLQRIGALLLACVLTAPAPAAQAAAAAPAPGSGDGVRPRRPVSTYSIVARDPDTGELGVAVQSHWFSVGPVVPWARSGVGAVATQSFVNIAHGPDGLDLMAAGTPPGEALARLMESDESRDVRQVALVDARGRVAAHTGKRCIAAAGHRLGDGYSVQANLMERDTVWDAMAEAFEEAEGDLASRLLAALHAAEAEGGDIRGRQSAALLVVRAESTGRPWEDRLVDLRVEDHPDPLVELERLLVLHRAYTLMDEGDQHFERGDVEAAMEAYTQALEIAPDHHEIAFWCGITLAGTGRVEEALPLLRRAYAGEPRLEQLVPRLPRAGLLPDDDDLVARLVGEP